MPPVDVHVDPGVRQRSDVEPFAIVHHVIEPVLGQKLFIVKVTDWTVPVVGLTDAAQCSSRRKLSSASRDCCCDWKRLFVSVVERDAETKRSPIPPSTTDRIAIVV